MIGVIAKPHQRWSAQELFELFKTPWEFARPGGVYDAVITTTGAIPDVRARFVIVSGPEPSAWDRGAGLVRGIRTRGAMARYRCTRVPVYGSVTQLQRTSAVPGRARTEDGLHVLECDGQIYLGYDLFDEVALLLGEGQPTVHAAIPTLDLHIALLREWMVNAGLAVVEIPPVPADHPCIVCLTHDIDFAGIRHHRFDHTMWGFLYRATVGAGARWLHGQIPFAAMARSWRAAATLPLVHAGFADDFWEPFAWYMNAEHGLPATYFLIPFKGRCGERVSRRHAGRRAAAYDVDDLQPRAQALVASSCEVAVHGIDAWHSVDHARAERRRIGACAGQESTGMRVHWLLHDDATPQRLDEAGYEYDSTGGYNDTIGFRHGTAQAFQPRGARTLLELPLHIQDGALFFPDRLGLSEAEAWKRCLALLDHVVATGGVLTVLWHDRSHAPERLWGDFYLRLLEALRRLGAWFATGRDAAGWFRKRRRVRFLRGPSMDSVRILGMADAEDGRPPLRVRVSRRGPGAHPQVTEVAWTGAEDLELDALLERPAFTRVERTVAA